MQKGQSSLGQRRGGQRLSVELPSSRQERPIFPVLVVVLLATLTWGVLLNGVKLNAAWELPDVVFYMRMARGQINEVPQPFCLRPLAPLLARWIASAGHWSIETGFSVVAFMSLSWTSGVVCWLLSRHVTARWSLLLVAAVPFWPQMLAEAGLPDPLYAALIAALLLLLEYDRPYFASLLMLPLMLARESTALTLACLLAVAWRKLGWIGSALGIACSAMGAVLVRYVSAGSLPNPEHLSGGLYFLGKVVFNAVRSLGVIPWSNVYPFLCSVPRWKLPVPLASIQAMGLCGWSPQAPLQMVLGILVPFGALPLLLPRVTKQLRRALADETMMFRFCVVYGGSSVLLAPMLGTWYVRLFGYGWPLLLVAVPHFVQQRRKASRLSRVGIAFLFLHLAVCVIGTFPMHARETILIACLEMAAVGVVLIIARDPGNSYL